MDANDGGTAAEETFTATSLESFADAATRAMPPVSGNVPEGFEVVSLGISHGGFVGRPQYSVTLRRLLEQPGEPAVG